MVKQRACNQLIFLRKLSRDNRFWITRSAAAIQKFDNDCDVIFMFKM